MDQQDTLKIMSDIADRYIRMGLANMSQKLDLLITLDYANKCYPMDFIRLLASKDADFIHDLNGININMDDSGKLLNCFVPRHAYVHSVADRATVERLLDDMNQA